MQRTLLFISLRPGLEGRELLKPEPVVFDGVAVDLGAHSVAMNLSTRSTNPSGKVLNSCVK
jgi:hypothetical protein